MARLLLVVALTAVIGAGGALAQSNNGAKVGKWGFLLNVTAFDHCPSGDFLDSNRHQIAVQANNNPGTAADKTLKINKIFLGPSDDFWVKDGNACDNGAYFYLPNAVASEYEVRARVLGKPGGKVTVTSCVEMMVDGVLESFCSVDPETIWMRTVGSGKEQNKWTNVSTQLLTICVDTTYDGQCDTRLGLFDPAGEDYWWQWDTQGRPHVQLVFFPVQ